MIENRGGTRKIVVTNLMQFFEIDKIGSWETSLLLIFGIFEFLGDRCFWNLRDANHVLDFYKRDFLFKFSRQIDEGEPEEW